jgi:hypothetical protein
MERPDGPPKVVSLGKVNPNVEEELTLTKRLQTDNGGVRGLATILVIRILMRDLNRRHSMGDDLEPWQVFDMIGGSGIGG